MTQGHTLTSKRPCPPGTPDATLIGAGYWAPRRSNSIDNAGPGFIHVGTLAELRARCKAVSTPGRAVLVLSDGDDVVALDNRCPVWSFRCIAAASPTVFSLVAHSLTARSRYQTGEFARRLMTQFTKKVTRTRPDHLAKTGRDNVHGASLGSTPAVRIVSVWSCSNRPLPKKTCGSVIRLGFAISKICKSQQLHYITASDCSACPLSARQRSTSAA